MNFIETGYKNAEQSDRLGETIKSIQVASNKEQIEKLVRSIPIEGMTEKQSKWLNREASKRKLHLI